MSDKIDATREPLPTTSDVVPTPPPPPPQQQQQQHQEQQQQHSMTNEQIREISRQLMGSEHLALRIHLDLTEAQAFALNEAFPNSQDRSYAMLKAWHDVVVESGENPRPLLAAAFVNASSNNLMARKVVGEGVFNAKACPKHATVVRLQKIIFRKDGYDCGDVHWSYDKNTKAHVAGHGGINLYGGNILVEGHLLIAGTSLSSNTVSNSLAHDGSHASLHSLNVYQGTVRVAPGGSIAIGPQSTPSSSNSFVRGETQNTMVDGPMLPETFNNSAISGQPFRKDFDNTLSHALMDILTEQMKSVGVLMSGDDMVGTVFRIGKTCIMTALHVIKCIIDPGNTGNYDGDRLEDEQIYVHFHKSRMIGNVKPPVEIFYLWKKFIWNEELDVAILDIKNPKQLPSKMRLSRSEVDLSDVSVIGYGNPKNPDKKVLDPRCKIEYHQSERMQRVFSWLKQNKSVLRTQLLHNAELIDVGYHGYDHPSVMLFDCFVTHGASGAPILSNTNEMSVTVVGVLTRGLPQFYFKLPDKVQKDVPDYCKLEMGSKMKCIYDWINQSDPELVQDFFS